MLLPHCAWAGDCLLMLFALLSLKDSFSLHYFHRPCERPFNNPLSNGLRPGAILSRAFLLGCCCYGATCSSRPLALLRYTRLPRTPHPLPPWIQWPSLGAAKWCRGPFSRNLWSIPFYISVSVFLTLGIRVIIIILVYFSSSLVSVTSWLFAPDISSSTNSHDFASYLYLILELRDVSADSTLPKY